MAAPHILGLWKKTLAVWLVLTTAFFGAAAHAATLDEQVRAAASLYFQGRTLAARDELTRLITTPEAAADPLGRLSAMSNLLDVCIHSYDRDCILKYAKDYAELAIAAPAANQTIKREQARRAGYYFDYARFTVDRRDITATILDGPIWKNESAFNVELYLDRRALAANILLELDRPEDALREVDQTLSVIASLKNPDRGRFVVAFALMDAMRTLSALDQSERAHGLYRVSGNYIARNLPAASVDAGIFRMAEGELLQQVGDLDGADRALALATATFRANDMDPRTRDWLLSQVLSMRAVVCGARRDAACARQALDQHPLKASFASARAATTFDEVSYLAARALVSALRGEQDALAGASLSLTGPLQVSPDVAERAEVYRAAGRALSLPTPSERLSAARDLGRALKVAADRRGLSSGAWYRPGAVDQIILGLALAASGEGGGAKDQQDVDFALFQLAWRSGPAYDADALTVLGQAKTELQRRAAHEALRLRARRDRLERSEIQAVLARVDQSTPGPSHLTYDVGRRRIYAEYAGRVLAAQRDLHADGIELAGANIASLERFQAALADDEAALFIGPGLRGLSYMCIRRGEVQQTSGAADMGQLQRDMRLLQLSLTATYAPSESLDSQFPAEAAVRVHDVLIRPFAACLRDGDRIIWLPGIAGATGVAVPLAVLLPSTPPRRAEGGYDLAAADWLVRRHAVSYPGGASALIAARSKTLTATPNLDFLGVGDPVLSGTVAGGETRAKVVLRGVRGASELKSLAPLPDTRDELDDSGRSFRSRKILVGQAATERGVRGELLGSYRYLSFATHGLMREDLQGLAEPALVLTPVSANDPVDNGLLTASEIADLNLQARFVALSACNTANFDLSQIGQDLPALASAFAVAGVPSTLATLWPVNSETGRRVVASTFGTISVGGQGPAHALADAQRRFLREPPSGAYLHPRFWAPFVILGDGGEGQDGGAPAPELRQIEWVTQQGGEVMSIRRSAQGTVTRYISDRNAAGHHAAGLRLTPHRGQTWRVDTHEIGASAFTADLSGGLLVAGYHFGQDQRAVPVLALHDPRSGAVLRRWRGDGLSKGSAAVHAGVARGDRAYVLIIEFISAENANAKMWLLEFGPSLEPRQVASWEAPSHNVDEATLQVDGDDLVVTYSDSYRRRAEAPVFSEDDFRQKICFTDPVTWIERRDLQTGALKARREVRGLTATSSVRHRGTGYLAGYRIPGCGEDRRAVIVTLDGTLQTHPFFEDETFGGSQVKVLRPLSDGRFFVAASKEAQLEFRPSRPLGDLSPVDPENRHLHSAMVFVVDEDGAAGPVRMLEAGSDVYVDDADTSDAADILLGGGLGDRAVVFHVAVPGRADPPRRAATAPAPR